MSVEAIKAARDWVEEAVMYVSGMMSPSFEREGRELLANLDAAIKAAQPDGWVSVPRAPTPEMVDAICSVRFKQGAEMYREIYKTMLAAAPKEAR